MIAKYCDTEGSNSSLIKEGRNKIKDGAHLKGIDNPRKNEFTPSSLNSFQTCIFHHTLKGDYNSQPPCPIKMPTRNRDRQ